MSLSKARSVKLPTKPGAMCRYSGRLTRKGEQGWGRYTGRPSAVIRLARCRDSSRVRDRWKGRAVSSRPALVLLPLSSLWIR
jgi:hypothetical protein